MAIWIRNRSNPKISWLRGSCPVTRAGLPTKSAPRGPRAASKCERLVGGQPRSPPIRFITCACGAKKVTFATSSVVNYTRGQTLAAAPAVSRGVAFQVLDAKRVTDSINTKKFLNPSHFESIRSRARGFDLTGHEEPRAGEHRLCRNMPATSEPGDENSPPGDSRKAELP